MSRLASGRKILLDIIIRIFLDRLHLHIAICGRLLFQKIQRLGSIDVFMHLSQITQMTFNGFKAVICDTLSLQMHSFTIYPIFRSAQYNHIHLFLLSIFTLTSGWPLFLPHLSLSPALLGWWREGSFSIYNHHPVAHSLLYPVLWGSSAG